MTSPLHIVLTGMDWLSIFGHYLLLSLMSVGGPMSTITDMHLFLVDQHQWLTQSQFNDSIAVSQAAPGPNVLFVALLGWNVGMNAGGYAAAFVGVIVTMVGILLPSTALAYFVTRWGLKNRERIGVRAFRLGMIPVVIALLLSTGIILAGANDDLASSWPRWLLSTVAGVVIWRTRIHLLWLLGAGAVLGGCGWI